tara:strand:- start:1148 stop:1510 length:363 start_codon:yes stop_codon:yes gene_type:complete
MANGQNANDFFNNPFREFTGQMLEYKPQLAYYSSPAAQSFARSPSRRQYFQRSFGDIYNQYLGELGTQLRSGQSPDLKFQDFLESDPFTKRYTSMTPSMRRSFGSEGTRTSAPSTRFIYF